MKTKYARFAILRANGVVEHVNVPRLLFNAREVAESLPGSLFLLAGLPTIGGNQTWFLCDKVNGPFACVTGPAKIKTREEFMQVWQRGLAAVPTEGAA